MNHIAPSFADTLRYLAVLGHHNVRAGFALGRGAVMAAVTMFANNLVFFVSWMIFFRNFSSLRGWTLADISVMYGIAAWSFGLMLVLMGGVRDIARTIADGALDVHLGRPRHPLPSLLFSRSAVSGWGDMASAFVFWFWFGDLTLADLPLVLALATAGTVILTAMMVVIQSAAFWAAKSSSMADDLFNMLVSITVYPQHTYGFVARVLLFTVLPAAFISLLPVEALREGSTWKAAATIGAGVFYGWIALRIFESGLKRYTSGNKFNEVR